MSWFTSYVDMLLYKGYMDAVGKKAVCLYDLAVGEDEDGPDDCWVVMAEK